MKFQHTAARRRLEISFNIHFDYFQVSTHSRPKAAGHYRRHYRRHYGRFQHTAARRRLDDMIAENSDDEGFNTQPPEGGWLYVLLNCPVFIVSTHSRPKAAGRQCFYPVRLHGVSTHSRPKAAGAKKMEEATGDYVSTHSRPKAAGPNKPPIFWPCNCFNTQPPEGGWV